MPKYYVISEGPLIGPIPALNSLSVYSLILLANVSPQCVFHSLAIDADVHFLACNVRPHIAVTGWISCTSVPVRLVSTALTCFRIGPRSNSLVRNDFPTEPSIECCPQNGLPFAVGQHHCSHRLIVMSRFVFATSLAMILNLI